MGGQGANDLVKAGSVRLFWAFRLKAFIHVYVYTYMLCRCVYLTVTVHICCKKMRA